MSGTYEQGGFDNVAEGQDAFMARGGIYQLALARMRKSGAIPRFYVYHEYPKAITITRGEPVKTARVSISCDKEKIYWDEMVPNEEVIVVNSEEEEERVLSGGQTSAQIEDARQGLLSRARSMGVPADPTWSAVRLRRELGETLDAPPVDTMGRLEAELAGLKKMQAMQAEIAALRAQLSAGEPEQPPIEELGDAKRRKVAA
jgi:hypothetical protein